MNRHTLGIGVLGIFLAVVCVFSLTQINSPVTQRKINLDENRIRDFQEIEYMMENHVRKTGALPPSLQALDVSPRSTQEAQDVVTDPETKQLYHYSQTSETSYQLCTTFATDSSVANNGTVSVQINTRYNHTAGYDCVELTLPKSLENTLTPTPTP